MAYSKQTADYGIPYLSAQETMEAAQEELAADIINNQLRAGILGAGGTRVFQNGSFSAVITDSVTGRVDVTLSASGSGGTSVQGIADDGLVELFDPVVWTDLAADSFYYLYIQAIESTYADPTAINIISSESPIIQNDYLFLATVDTTGTAGSPVIQPVIDFSPPGKPTAFNLFNLLNNNHDPFGPALTQTALTVLSEFAVLLDLGSTALFQQLNADASLAPVTIENLSSQPDINATSGPLRLADVNIPNGFALSDAVNTAYQGLAISIIGALNEILTELITHINNSFDPHGSTLYQTNMVLGGSLTVPQLEIHPVISPPAPPGPPLPPGQLSGTEISSTGDLRIGDIRGGLAWSDLANPYYLGLATSLMGALNELLTGVSTLNTEVGGLTGSTLPALMPVIFEIVPEDLGLNLHFKIIISDAEDFSNVIVTRESKTSVTGWWYESQPPAPPLPPAPPAPPANPYALPGVLTLPNPLPLPLWLALPTGGLPGNAQAHEDGRSIRVKYETQLGDHVFCRHRYSVAVQEYNGDYGTAELAAMTFD